MTNDHVRVRARISFLATKEGGRSSPLMGGVSYRPNHNFFGPDNTDMCIGFIELADGEQVAPGDTIEKDVSLSTFPDVANEIHEGREWRIQEGGKLVAKGTILKVLDQRD